MTENEQKRTLQIRPALETDIDRIMELYLSAQDFMIRSGNPDQWGHSYPNREIVEKDIRNEQGYVLYDDADIHGVFVILSGEEPTYDVIEGSWLNDDPYITIHRVAGDGTCHGIFKNIMHYCRQLSDNIRIDTHEKNLPMQRAIEREGFIRCGTIYVRDGSPRIAYQWTAA